MGRYSVYNIGLVFALHQQESVTSTHVFPHPEPSSHLTPQTIVLCCSRALALGALHHAMNLHQLSGCPASCTELAPVICLCTVMYMFQSYSLKSSHCCPLHRVQKSVLSTSVSFAALHVRSSWPSLQIAYICIPTQYSDFTSFCRVGSCFTHLSRKD